MGTKYDYLTLKQEYIQTPNLSIRELCRRHEIPTWSTVSQVAKREDWEGERQKFETLLNDKQMIALVEKRASKIRDIQDDMLSVIHAGVLKMGADMDAAEPIMDGANVLRDDDGRIMFRPVMRFGPNQFETMVKQYLALTGQPSQISEQRNLNLGINAEAGEDELRNVLAALRPGQPVGRAEGATDSAGPEKARTH